MTLRRPDRGALFVVSGPSGVGKSTLIHRAIEVVPGLEFSVSATTRPPREGEVDGVDYHFLTPTQFSQLVDAGAFLEHARVYDRLYGTLAEPTQAAIEEGRSLVLDIDVQGAANVRAHLPEAVLIMVLPPSLEALEARLRARATEQDDVIRRRMEQVAQQMGALAAFDYVVVNEDLDGAHRVLQAVLIAELSRVRRHPGLVEAVRGVLSARKHA